MEASSEFRVPCELLHGQPCIYGHQHFAEPCRLCVIVPSLPHMFLEGEAVGSLEPGCAWGVVGVQYLLAKWTSRSVSSSVKWDYGASSPNGRDNHVSRASFMVCSCSESHTQKGLHLV